MSQTKEITIDWFAFSANDKDEIVQLHALQLNIEDIKTLTRIFEICQPKIVLGRNSEGNHYGRVHADFAPTMDLLIKNYILNPISKEVLNLIPPLLSE